MRLAGQQSLLLLVCAGGTAKSCKGCRENKNQVWCAAFPDPWVHPGFSGSCGLTQMSDGYLGAPHAKMQRSNMAHVRSEVGATNKLWAQRVPPSSCRRPGHQFGALALEHDLETPWLIALSRGVLRLQAKRRLTREAPQRFCSASLQTYGLLEDPIATCGQVTQENPRMTYERTCMHKEVGACMHMGTSICCPRIPRTTST